MKRLCYFFIAICLFQGCSKPLDPIMGLNRIAIISIKYDPSIYYFSPQHGMDFSKTYADFSGDPAQSQVHVMILNEFVTDLMTKTVDKSGMSIVRPLKLLNTSLLTDENQFIQYEYLLKPYDPIDINNRPFMSGIANQLDVDAVAEIKVSYGVYLDEKTLWEEYNDPYAQVLNSKRLQLRHGHDSSELRTSITITVVNSTAELVYQETRYVDTHSDQIQIDDRDLGFDGGVSPKLLRLGLSDWLKDWVEYLPDYIDNV